MCLVALSSGSPLHFWGGGKTVPRTWVMSSRLGCTDLLNYRVITGRRARGEDRYRVPVRSRAGSGSGSTVSRNARAAGRMPVKGRFLA